MRFSYKFIFFLFAFAFVACEESKPATPLETLKTYTQAIKKKDTATMKRLLSSGSLKMAEQEAKAQGAPLDTIIERETLFSAAQTTVEFRNEKLDADKATIEMKDSMGMWNTVPFVREEGAWKIDKQSLANQMMQEIEQENNKEIDDIFKSGRIP
jgi:hypothetical protein